MSERLIKLVQDELIKEGIEVLSKRSNLSEGTIRHVAEGRSPRTHNAYKLAKACGLSDAEALSIARECPNRSKTA
jgi:hypothetical protein